MKPVQKIQRYLCLYYLLPACEFFLLTQFTQPNNQRNSGRNCVCSQSQSLSFAFKGRLTAGFFLFSVRKNVFNYFLPFPPLKNNMLPLLLVTFEIVWEGWLWQQYYFHLCFLSRITKCFQTTRLFLYTYSEPIFLWLYQYPHKFNFYQFHSYIVSANSETTFPMKTHHEKSHCN